MSERKWERVTAVAGILSVVLLLAEILIWGNPQYGDPVSKLKNVFVEHQRMAYISAALAAWSLVALLVFAAGLAATLRRLQADNVILSVIVVGAAVAFGAAQIAFGAVSGTLVLNAAHASDSEINMMQGALTYLDALRFMPFGLMTVAAGLAMTSGLGFARWIGWVGIASGLANLLAQVSLLDPEGPLGNAGNAGQVGFLLYIIWALAVGGTLLRHPVAAAAPAAAAARAEVASA
jgi:hypothetical protein